MKLSGQIALAKLRSQARQRLESTQPERRPFSASEVELSTLNLLEEYVRSDPEQALAPSSPTPKGDLSSSFGQSLAQSAAHLSGLGAGHSLAPALTEALGQIRWGLFSNRQGNLQTLGSMTSLSSANKAVGPHTETDWDVKITGHWTDQQLNNVKGAVSELGRKTGTKAINLLREVHLRTHLGDIEEGPILGLTSQPGPIALRRDQADHAGRTRWIIFHEVGHQLDRFLSGRSTSFRSHQADSPFGQSKDPSDYVDPNQVGCPHEDFADCHARAIYDYDKIQSNPDLYVHARGELGKKMTWILQNGYGDEVPGPSSRYEACLGEIDSGGSPFEDRKDFHRAVNVLLDQPERLTEIQRDWLRNQLNERTACGVLDSTF